MKALIDGDVLVYQFGWIAQSADYTVLDNEGEVLFSGRNKTECNNFIKEVAGFGAAVEEYTVSKGEDVCTPIEDTYSGIDTRIEWITKKSKCTTNQVYLSGKNNFREGVATIKPYKGNRSGDKPLYYERIREYFVEKHNAIVSEGEEADDLLGIYQTEDTCICTIDKDLWTVPGLHFNFKSALLDDVTKEESVYNLQHQHILGDRVDNIPGIRGMGPVKTEKALRDKSEEERWLLIADLYKKEYGNDWEKSLLEVGTLLYIRQEKDEVWEVPESCFPKVRT
jgi:hypothetical protein